MELQNAIQIIKSARQIRADYTTGVRERTYLSGKESEPLDIKLGSQSHRC